MATREEPNWLKASRIHQAAERVERGEDVRVVFADLHMVSTSMIREVFAKAYEDKGPGMFNEERRYPPVFEMMNTFFFVLNRMLKEARELKKTEDKDENRSST